MKITSSKFEKWNIKLKVTSQERKKIQKEAIDLDMRVAEYIKFRVLGNLPVQNKTMQGKSA